MAEPARPAEEPAAAEAGAGGYGWFVGGAVSWFGAMGMQQVLLTWLVVGELQASPEWVGVAQTSTMLGGILLIPIGGVVADRLDPRRLLLGLHVLAAAPPLVLAASVELGFLTIPLLMAAGVVAGGVNAFSQPAREALLPSVAGDNLVRAVTGLTLAQFGSQGIGMLVAGTARWLGSPLALSIQGLWLATGFLPTRKLPSRQAPPSHARSRPSIQELAEGARTVLSGELLPVFLLIAGIGLFFQGSYHVVLPLAVRDVYGGGVQDVSLLLMMFPVGTIAGSALLLFRGGIRRKGRALALALAAAGLALLVASRGLPFWGLMAATLAWGLAGAVFLNMSRILFQEHAPDASRARVLAVHQLGFMLTGPVGALAAGAMASRLGILPSLAVMGAAMLFLVGLVTGLSRVRHME